MSAAATPLVPGLEGRAIVITGGASGMGAALVRAFTRAGARIASLDRSAEAGQQVVDEANEAACGTAQFFACDVSDEASVEAAFAAAVAHLGGMETLIHAAGIAPGCPAESISLEEWENVFAVNTRGTFLTNRAAFAHLKERGGRILNFASGAGVSGLPNKAHYSATKGAVIAWTRTLAKEWGRHGITVNAIAPAISTPMYAKTRSKMSAAQLEALDARMASDMPIGGRLGDCDRDLVPVLAFMATEAARFITGQIIPVDGGLMMVR